MFYLGYNTNGFAHHRLVDVLPILHELGYTGVGLTPDVHHLDPASPTWLHDVEQLAKLLNRYSLKCVLETGARFVLDPWRKHQPTLLSHSSTERAIRRNFLKQLAFAAPILGCSILSFWSGSPVDDAPPAIRLERLVQEIQLLLSETPESVRFAFEPEPGMFVETMPQFQELAERVNDARFGLTLDIGHLICTGEVPVKPVLEHFGPWLWNVHLEDMRAGVHDHLMFGAGEVPFGEVFAGLRAINYSGGVFVELSRHSYDAVNTARKSQQFLKPYFEDQNC